MRPITSRRVEIEKARDERRKVRKRTRAAVPAAQAASANVGSSTEANVEVPSSGDVRMDHGTNEPEPEQSDGGELRPEEWYREQEKAELEALVDPSIKSDTGASQTGLYELAGELPLFIFHHHWCTITLARLFSYHHA
jgi:ubiquitin carboxyl-terminal hydrolase 14